MKKLGFFLVINKKVLKKKTKTEEQSKRERLVKRPGLILIVNLWSELKHKVCGIRSLNLEIHR